MTDILCPVRLNAWMLRGGLLLTNGPTSPTVWGGRGPGGLGDGLVSDNDPSGANRGHDGPRMCQFWAHGCHISRKLAPVLITGGDSCERYECRLRGHWINL